MINSHIPLHTSHFSLQVGSGILEVGNQKWGDILPFPLYRYGYGRIRPSKRETDVPEPELELRGRGRCVQCVADSDCNPTRKYCFQNKCSTKLSGGATCVRDSWCAAGNCTDNVCVAMSGEDGEGESRPGPRGGYGYGRPYGGYGYGRK